VILATTAYGSWRLAEERPYSGTIRVGLVQGNVPEEEKWEPSARLRIFDAHLEATRRAAESGATLVVWPESSVPLPLVEKPAYREALESLAREKRIDLLVGSVHHDRRGLPDERTYNSAFLLPGRGAGSSGERYDKIHLVPYGEYVPLREWLGFVSKLVTEASDFSPGSGIVVMKTEGARIGPLVCFEAIFPPLVRRFTAGGAQVLVNLTNDAFLGDSAGPRQHLALAQIRSVENRRWFLRAANTGISVAVDDRGRVIESIPYGTAGVIVADVSLFDDRTFYVRFGDVAGWACVILAVAATVFLSLKPGGISWTRSFFDTTPP
jgi:apolipoprotein N-acyltransferase